LIQEKKKTQTQGQLGAPVLPGDEKAAARKQREGITSS